MTAISRSRSKFAILIPVLVYLLCMLISFSAKFKTNPGQFSLAIVIDLLITAPLAWYLVIRKTGIPKVTVLRVFMLGILVSTILLSKADSPLLSFIKVWISPIVEISLVGFIAWKFYKAKQKFKKNDLISFDFLAQCRAILVPVLGNEKAVAIMAAEISVFYYSFCKKEKKVADATAFTSYKENGIILIFATVLGLFIIETTGMHFVFLLWNNTAAWIMTTLSLYTCLQLFAHTRALKIRTTLLTNEQLWIRNGILGGEALIQLNNIEKAIKINKPVVEKDVVKIGLLNSFEKPNIALYLKKPVVIIKAFGMIKKSKLILLSMDKPDEFIKTLDLNE